MNVIEKINNSFLYIDGGMGTILQSKGLVPGELPEIWNITHSDVIRQIHLEYIDSGAQIVTTNTFGANELKFDGSNYNLKDIVFAAVQNAKSAVEKSQKDVAVALSIGPCGKLLKPLGELAFEDAVKVFGKTARLGYEAGADLVIVETMNDMYEMKAAVLGVKENCNLPVFVTAAFDEKGKLMTGGDAVSVVAMLEGLSVDAIGLNCGLGPHAMVDISRDFVRYSSLPIIVSPNAGMPKSENGVTVFDTDADEFSEVMAQIARLGVHGLGGCCGTTPKYIAKVVEKTKDIEPQKITQKNHTIVSSYTHSAVFSDIPLIIGERINPTGKKKLKQALRENSFDYILSEAVKQQESGAHILDVNVGLPEIDEHLMLTKAVYEIQSVIDLPLQLDSSDPKALESAMRVYNGKPMINSVNGKVESMEAVFPLVKKYGGVVVALTLDENGIPDTALGRYEIAQKIINKAKSYGIDKKNIVVDALSMAVSSQSNGAIITLQTVEMLKKELGVNTVLGVSNISFGLPMREVINSSFFTLALQSGLSSAIVNPLSDEMMKAYHGYLALMDLDSNFERYIDFASSNQQTKAVPDIQEITLEYAVVKGLSQQAQSICEQLVKTDEPMTIVNDMIIPALDKVGKGFEENTVFLPQLLMSAEAAKAAFDVVKSTLSASSQAKKGTVALATVQGDIHDIGKNIVKVLLENYGFEVLDLGRDVPIDTVAESVRDNNITLLGLSALMTTTVVAMEKTIKLVKKQSPDCKIMVGGAVLTQEYADMIGADFYGRDAMESVRYAEKHFNK